MEFHLVKMGKRPLLAFPSGTRARLRKAVGCYPEHTWRKRWVKKILLTIAGTGLLPILFSRTRDPLPSVSSEEWSSWLESIQGAVDDGPLFPVLVWPADPGRGRVYISLLNEAGVHTGFAKLALDERNSGLIDREKAALQSLNSLSSLSAKIPKIKAAGRFGDYSYLLTEATPSAAKPMNWERDDPIHPLVAQYRGPLRQLKKEDLERMEWWRQIHEDFSDCPDFLRELDQSVATGMVVCRVHGDLNRTNILRWGSKVWLLDWEQSRPDGPCLTDPVCMAIDQLWSRYSSRPEWLLEEFHAAFLHNQTSEEARKILPALAYLAAVRFPPAIAIIRQRFG